MGEPKSSYSLSLESDVRYVRSSEDSDYSYVRLHVKRYILLIAPNRSPLSKIPRSCYPQAPMGFYGYRRFPKSNKSHLFKNG